MGTYVVAGPVAWLCVCVCVCVRTCVCGVCVRVWCVCVSCCVVLCCVVFVWREGTSVRDTCEYSVGCMLYLHILCEFGYQLNSMELRAVGIFCAPYLFV